MSGGRFRNRSKAVKVYWAIALIHLLSVAALGQNTQTAARPDRGAVAGASYSVSDVESISLSNGNLNLSIPLASLPSIAGGKLSLTLRATYNSKLWDVTRQEARYNGLYANSYVIDAPVQSDRGGWTIGAGYSLIFREAHDDFNYLATQQNQDPDSSELLYTYYKALLVTPDGAEHALYPVTCGRTYSGTTTNHDYLLGYCSDNPYTTAKGYYTADGSFIYVSVTPVAGGGYSWSLYTPDGTQVIDSGGVQQIKDTNGNSISIYTETDASTGVKITHYKEDRAGRELKLIYEPSANSGKGRYRAQYQTVGGGWAEVVVNMDKTTVRGVLYNRADWNPSGEGTVDGGGECYHQEQFQQEELAVVRSIVYPATELNQPGPGYSFSYNSDTYSELTSQVQWACQTPLQSYTRETSDGMGELSSMQTPTGAVVNYTYGSFGSTSGSLFFTDANNMARRFVSSKSVEHDGTTDTWTYLFSTQGAGVTVTAPDGSVTTETAYPHDSAYSHHFGMTGKSGLTYRTNHSGKVITEKHWTLMRFDGGLELSPGSRTDKVIFNPVVDAEYTTLLEGGVAVKMSARTFQYDYNGNLLQTIEYDWFDPGPISRDAEGVPTAVPSNATKLRVVKNSYYNDAAAPSSANVYAKRSASSNATVVLNAPMETTVENAVGTVLSRTQFSYDNQNYGIAPTLGNLTKLSSFDDQGDSNTSNDRWVEVSTTYDSYGNRTSVTDARGKVTLFEYDDPLYGLPNRVIVDPQNGTGQQTAETTYDHYTGLVLSQKDMNGKITTIDYTNQLLPNNTVDPFGRPGVVYSPAVLLNSTSQKRKVVTTYEDHLRRMTVASDLKAEGDKLLKSRSTSDMLGRTVLVEQNEGGTDFTISSRTIYEQAGRVVFNSNPYRNGEDAPTDGWIRSKSDQLGRVTEVATFAGKVQPTATASNWNGRAVTAYDAQYTTVTDQAGKVRRRKTDALGRLVRVDEPDSSGNLGDVDSPAQPTAYTYDALGNLTQVAQGAQTRSFTYSSLSRLVSATNPESGTISYWYDAAGNLVLKTDPRTRQGNLTLSDCSVPYTGTKVATCYEYDALGRIRSRKYNDGTPDVTYTYDTLTNGKGRLTSVSSSVSTYAYAGYDEMGRVTGSTQTTNGVPYIMPAYKYDLAGNLTSQQYPSGRVVTSEYDDAGRLSAVMGQKAGEDNKTYASSPSYSALGAMKDFKLGNNLWEHTAFNSRLQPTEIGLGGLQGAVDKLKLEYSYGTTNNNGNVLSQTITVPTIGTVTGYSATQGYTYDELNRLKSATETSGSAQTWKQVFDYDRYGNRIITEGHVEDTARVPHPTQTHPTLSHWYDQDTNRLKTQAYDLAGNVIKDTAGQNPGNIFDYDAENKQVRYNGGAAAGGADYQYDGNGRRVKKVVGTGLSTTVFVYNAMDQLVAEYDSVAPSGTSGTSYLTSDHLGTPRVITDSNGAVKARHDYMPFGEEIAYNVGGRSDSQKYVYGTGEADKLRQKFTQKERDVETDFDYSINRYYSPAQGRFTSVDPENAGASVTDPQSWNGYPYAANNPLKFTDPLGLSTVCRLNGQIVSCGEVLNDLRNGNFDTATLTYNGVSTTVRRADFTRVTYEMTPDGYTVIADVSFNASGFLAAAQRLAGAFQDFQENSGNSGEWTGFSGGSGNTGGAGAGGNFDCPSCPAFKDDPYHPQNRDARAATSRDIQRQMRANPETAARQLGYTRRIPPQKAPFDSHGEPVFSNGRDYITPDNTSHRGGVWKKIDRNGKRLGTYDAELKWIAP